MRHILLVIILALSAWALWPPGESAATADGPKLGREVTRTAQVKHVLRIHPGPIYLPGVIPENATRPIEGMNKVAERFERLFPDTRIEFVGVPSGQREWLVTQLSSGQAPDVIMVNVEDVWQDVQKGWYIPLDDYLERPNPFCPPGTPGSEKWWDLFKYPVPTLGTMAPNGKMYCIVLDMIETGIFYNKDVFKRLGLSEPRDWSDFMRIQRELRDAGYTPMLADKMVMADWGVDLIFDQLYYDLRPLLDVSYDPRRGDYLKGYLDWDEIIFLHQQGFFTENDPRWVELWTLLKEWRQYMARDISTTDMVKSFLTERGAMLWSSSMLVNKLVRDPHITFDWGVFYPPPIPQSYSRFAAGREMAVIGGSAMQYSITNSAIRDTRDPATSERLQRVVSFLQFLTTPENCHAVVNETIALLPNIKGVDPHPELMPFHEFLQQHYSMTKWTFTFDLQFSEVLQRMLELYLNDGLTLDEYIGWMDRNIQSATATITRRKNIDLSPLQAEWDRRAPLRAEYRELPAPAAQ